MKLAQHYCWATCVVIAAAVLWSPAGVGAFSHTLLHQLHTEALVILWHAYWHGIPSGVKALDMASEYHLSRVDTSPWYQMVPPAEAERHRGW